MRKQYLVDRRMELEDISNLEMEIRADYPDLGPENTLVLMVSPDYSATLAMHVAHALSRDGEMCSILPIHVPYPDDTDIHRWKVKAEKDLKSYLDFEGRNYDNYLLVEAGVIRGGNYTWLTNLLRGLAHGRIITAALYENVHSKFKSDVVVNYYDDQKEDLTFWFERYNKHWPV